MQIVVAVVRIMCKKCLRVVSPVLIWALLGVMVFSTVAANVFVFKALSVASDWLASFSTNCHFLVNNSRNKIVKILKIFMDIDHLRSRGVFCQL